MPPNNANNCTQFSGDCRWAWKAKTILPDLQINGRHEAEQLEYQFCNENENEIERKFESPKP